MTSTILKATLSELIDTMEAEAENCDHYVDLAKGLREVKGRLLWLPRESKAKFGDGPVSYPTLVLVGDDDDAPTGPSGFAQTLIPAAADLSPLKLRNHISSILAFIANDLESPQTESEQLEKSHGEKFKSTGDSAAETHAALRLAGGFNMDQMVSEFRALRASVVKLWEAQLGELTPKDIADLTRFNESIDQALTEAISYYSKKLGRSRNLFLGILTHDMRNPLSAARMSAELSWRIDNGTLGTRQRMLMTQVVESTDRTMEIIDHLLDLTRARLGSGLPIIKEHMDMGFVSRQLTDEMRTMYPGRTITLDIIGNAEGKWDKPRMGQVFSNLLGNAIQYSFTDSPIAVKVEGSTHHVVISVHNEGVPIPPDAMGRIFDSLTRGETEPGNPTDVNLGLGLYIIKEIVSAHGGVIDVTSTEKAGTTFTARFPRQTKEDEPAPPILAAA